MQWYADRRATLAPHRQQQRARYTPPPVEMDDSFAFDVIDSVLVLVLIGLCIKAWQMVRQRGGLRAVMEQRQRALLQQRQHHMQQRAAAAAAAGGHQPPQAPRPDFDRVVAALQKLPTEAVAGRAELERESTHELKARLARLGVECRGCVEKGELVEKLLGAGGGSSGESCAICASDYVPGDVVRVLPCRHRMHVECVDLWLLKSAEHSAPKGCPLCNDARWLTEA
jgi:hypothetical protein